MCYIVVNVTDELLRDLGHDCMLKVHPLFNDLPCIGWKDFARLRAPLRYTENVVLQCSCAMSSIGIQTDLANGAEFRELETGLLRDDALVQTREKVRSVNFTSEEIVEVTDDLTVVTSKTVLHARESVMLTAAETEGETCESLICPIADAEKRPRDPTARDVATAAAPQEAEASRNSLVLAHEASEVSGETLDEKIPAAEEMRMDDDVCAMSVKRAVKKNSLDTAAITVVVTGEEREEVRESSNKVSLRPPAYRDISIVDEATINVTVGLPRLQTRRQRVERVILEIMSVQKPEIVIVRYNHMNEVNHIQSITSIIH